MLFRNMRLKYFNEAGADGADGGGQGGAVTNAEDGVTKPEVKLDKGAITEPAKTGLDTEVPSSGTMDQYVEQYAADKPALSLALSFLKDAGVSPEDTAFKLAEVDGDFTLLEAMLAQKGLPGTDQMLGILKGEVEAHRAAVAEAQEKSEAQVAEILGESQEEILDWARETATEEEKEAINSMFEAGGVYAAAAAIMLRENFMSTTNPTKPAETIPVTPKTPQAHGQMTASAYASAVQELAKKVGGDPRGTPEYAALTQKRAAARARGI